MPHSSENTRTFIRQYWNFFETLEDDFIETERYVSLDEDNFDTFSIEYNRLYQSVCSEIDVVAKYLCELLGDSKANNIVQYCATITTHCGKFTSEAVAVKQLITITPWDKWAVIGKSQSDNPEWWTLYNKVKHNRQSLCTDSNSKWNNKPYHKCATQKNVLLSLAGLYILEFYCLLLICKHDCDASDDEANSIYNAMLPLFSSKLFSMPSWDGCHLSFIGEYIDKKVIEKKMVEHQIMI
jgi:hypothetical protein